MRTYEALYIVRPDTAEDDVQTMATEVESLLTAQGGAVVRSELWGKRRLAYEVQKCTEGYFTLLRFTATPNFIARLENHFRLTDAIIRYLVVHFDENMLRLEASQKKRKEAEALNAAHVRPRRDRDEDDEEDDRRPRGRRYSDDDDDEAEEE